MSISGGLSWLYSHIMESYVITKKVKMLLAHCHERISHTKVRCLMLHATVSAKMGKGENTNVYVTYICTKITGRASRTLTALAASTEGKWVPERKGRRETFHDLLPYAFKILNHISVLPINTLK